MDEQVSPLTAQICRLYSEPFLFAIQLVSEGDADYIIVGAGSAGAVVAARLSADPSRSVLLLEAGPDYATEVETPRDLLDGGRLAGMAHDWNYIAIPCGGRSMPYRRGRVVGGTSAINAAAALWPRPADFERWVALGNPEWS